jgi:hypothetical protein
MKLYFMNLKGNKNLYTPEKLRRTESLTLVRVVDPNFDGKKPCCYLALRAIKSKLHVINTG